MKKMYLLKIVLFILVLNLAVFHISYTLLIKRNGYNSIEYYKNNNQLDIIWIGPSTPRPSIIPMYIWNKYHITSFNYSHNGQRLTTWFTFDDMTRYNPKLIFFDISLLINNDFTTYIVTENKNFKWLLSMHSRYEYLKYTNGKLKDIFYFFLLNDFHTRWKELKETDFINNNVSYYFMGAEPSYRVNAQKRPVSSTGQYSLNEETIKIIDEIAQYLIKYVQETNCPVVFYTPPTASQAAYERSLIFYDLIKKYNIPYINFNNFIDELNIDYGKDFLDATHLNAYGGIKMTDYLIEYAVKNYNIPTHENDLKYNAWNKDYIEYSRLLNKRKIGYLKSYTDWYDCTLYDNYTMIIASNGNNVLNRLPNEIKEQFKSFGLNKFETDKGNQKYIAVIDDGKVFYEEISDERVEYKGRMNNKVNLLVSSDSQKWATGKAEINVSGKPVSKNKYGLNLVVYDKINREIVDSIWLDPKNFNQVLR